jgi:heptosyltransferase-2
MTTPLTKAIKTLIPHCHLVYATDLEYSQGALADIINHNPYVDELIPFNRIQESEYDYSVDVTATGLRREKSGVTPPNRIDMFAEEVGVDISADPLPIYVVQQEERERAKAELRELVELRRGQKLIAIQAKSNDARRTWPLDHMARLLTLLSAEERIQTLFFDWGDTTSRWSPPPGGRVHFLFNRNLADVAALMEQCDLVVCPDSALLHLAGALQKKIVAIFGPIPPVSRMNYYSNSTAVARQLPCQPCWYSPRCTRSGAAKLECLTGISPESVLQAVKERLATPLTTVKSIIYGAELTDKGQDPIILVKRTTDGLGDLLMTTPALAALKNQYPGKQLHVACQRKLWPVLQNNPDVDKIIDITENINKNRYHMIIDISTPCARYEATRVSAGKPVQKSRVEIFAEATGVRDTIRGLTPIYHVTKDETAWAQEFMERADLSSGKPRVGVALRSAEMYRNWPEDRYQRLFDLVQEHMDIVILDHSREHMFKDIVDACGFPLRKAIAILSQCDGLITVDTSLLHFGAALKVPTIALFGPIDYRPRCKAYKNVTVVQSDLDCIPCWRNSRMPCKTTGIVRGYSKCLEAVSAGHIARIAIQKFAGEHDG